MQLLRPLCTEKRGRTLFLGLFLLGQILGDFLLLGLEPLFTALAGFLGLRPAGLSLLPNFLVSKETSMSDKNWFLMPFCYLVAKSCSTLCYLMDCSLPGSSVHGISQMEILEWIAICFSRGSSRLRDWTPISCIAGRSLPLSHQGSLTHAYMQSFIFSVAILFSNL